MAIDDEILFPEIALFKESRIKQNAKISKLRKRRQLKKAKYWQLNLEGTGKKMGAPPSLEADQPLPPWISDVDAGERTSLDPVRDSLLDDKGYFDKDSEMPDLPVPKSQGADPRRKMKPASSDSSQGMYCLRPHAGGFI